VLNSRKQIQVDLRNAPGYKAPGCKGPIPQEFFTPGLKFNIPAELQDYVIIHPWLEPQNKKEFVASLNQRKIHEELCEHKTAYYKSCPSYSTDNFLDRKEMKLYWDYCPRKGYREKLI
jgi:hypothetical protein